MAREVTRFEAETDPPRIHTTIREAVISEIAAILGILNADKDPPHIARVLVNKAPAVIACLAQLPEPTQQENARV